MIMITIGIWKRHLKLTSKIMIKSTYKAKMTSDSQEYETTDEIFIPLDKEFNFKLDGCVSGNNCKVDNYYSKKDDCFSKNWDLTTWVNPEFFTVRKFVKKAYDDSEKFNVTIVMLCLVKSNTNWWGLITPWMQKRFDSLIKKYNSKGLIKDYDFLHV